MAITIDDFSKIWASTSPLTPYDFSDDNYKQGWNFVGATPPSRQMWDSVQKSNDEKLKYLLDNFADYLPLAGGTMAGAIVGNPLTLSADDGNDSADLVLNPSGSATWNGKEVERVQSSSTNYIRYESGLQICWGYEDLPPSTNTSVTFPVAFNNTPSVSLSVLFASEFRVYGINSTKFSTSTTSTTSSQGGYWIAIGTWK